jgi:exopolysaccharide/PEP-CTERM locus tyrosine autokinase
VSLIESALEKLRRVGERDGPTSVPTVRPVVPAPSAPKASVVVVPPAPHHNRKRITIDPRALRRAGYLPDEGLERRFADHYRQIKRPLIEKALAGPADMRVILVSSALPGDGKTFTSINLTLSMARERDVSVLLVDADAPRGHVSEVFGLRGERGLLDALSDESLDVEALIVETDVPGFEILPAGRFVENATELLASARMEQIAARISARSPRRIVILDSAPLLVSSEARVLLRIPGQVLLVVRAGKTPRQAIVDAAAYVERKRLQGVVLNQAPFRTAGGYYYGYPGYGEEAKPETESGA